MQSFRCYVVLAAVRILSYITRVTKYVALAVKLLILEGFTKHLSRISFILQSPIASNVMIFSKLL